jgi:four helix bundle protein
MEVPMQSHFRNLTVYRAALRVTASLFELTRRVPYEARPVVRQLMRASTSVVLNIAEGAGEYRALEKARIYRIARRSSWEVSAALDILGLMSVVPKGKAESLQQELNGIGAMLTTMSKNFQKGAEEGTWDPKDAKQASRLRRKAESTSRRFNRSASDATSIGTSKVANAEAPGQEAAHGDASGNQEAANGDASGNQEAANGDASGNQEAARE